MAINSYSRQYGRMSRGTMLPPPRKNMSKSLVSLFFVGLAGWSIYKLASPSEHLVTGKSGKSWRVVLRGKTGDVKEYEVFAPANSWGPHAELSVLRYSQTGSDMGSRKIVGVGAGVPEAMKAGAASDFGLPTTGGALPLGSSS
jgi:hypothetical protein